MKTRDEGPLIRRCAAPSPRGRWGTKKAICSAAGGLLLFAFYCVIGSMDQGTIGVTAGGILATALMLAGCALLWKAGWFRWD